MAMFYENPGSMKIFHPGYGASSMKQPSSDFLFSDDLKKWTGTSKKEKREIDKVRVKRKYKPRKKKHG